MPTTTIPENDSFIDRRVEHDRSTRITRRGKRFRAAGLAILTAAGVASTVKAADAGYNYLKASHTVENPAPDAPHKDVLLGKTYVEPDGTEVTPTTLIDVARAAHLPQEILDVTKMLADQAAAEGYTDVSKLPEGFDVRLPLEAQIGAQFDPNQQG